MTSFSRQYTVTSYRIINQLCKSFRGDFLDSKNSFPNSQLISYQRPRSIKDITVKINHRLNKKSMKDKLPPKHSKSFMSNLVNILLVIPKPRINTECRIEGGRVSASKCYVNNVPSAIKYMWQ